MGLPRTSVVIELDRPRQMRASLNALVRIEEECGKSIDEVMGNGARVSMKDTRALLWALLRDDDPGLTIEQVGDLIDAGNVQEIGEKIGETLTKAGAGTPQGKSGNARSRSTGRRSGPTDGSISDSATPSSGD